MYIKDIYRHQGTWMVFTGLKDENTNLPVSIEDNKAAVYLLEEKFEGRYGAFFDIPEEIIISDSEDLFLKKINPGKYIVSTVVIKCMEWHLSLPKTIEEVVIDRENYNGQAGNSENSLFSVDKENPYFMSDKGSLYSKDGKILYHYHSSEKSEILNDVEDIRPGAIYRPNTLSLKVPSKCITLKQGAIVGNFNSIDFAGGLIKLEQGALDEINCKEIKINGFLSDINLEGRQELKKWYNEGSYRSSHNLYFASPQPNGGKTLGNGFIELTEVLTIDEKLENQKDSSPVYFNSFINERFENEKVTIPIIIRTIKISETYLNRKYNFYSPQDVTEIQLADVRDKNTESGFIYILVYETAERVLDLIHESFLRVK